MKTLHTTSKCLRNIGTATGMMLVALTMWVGAGYTANADSLYIGDYYDNTVKQFDADTGDFQGKFGKSQGGVHFPNGIIFDSAGNLLLANQNGNTGVAGEILQYSSAGKLLNQIVRSNDPNAPIAPQGIILASNTLFVADLLSASIKGNPVPPGHSSPIHELWVFLGASVPGTSFTAAFHPRGVVLGPDGLLYVSNVPEPPSPGRVRVWRAGPAVRSQYGAPLSMHLFPAAQEGMDSSTGRRDWFSAPMAGSTSRASARAPRRTTTRSSSIRGAALVDQIDLDTVGFCADLRASAALRPGWETFRPDHQHG